MKPVKNDPQSIGSAITYAKRYALSAIFGITSDQDDDGNEATQTKKQPSTKTKKQDEPVISVEKANYYLREVAKISTEKGKEDGSIVKWFLKHLGVVDYKQIKESQVEQADMLLNKLKGN